MTSRLETVEMSRVITEATFENLEDLWAVDAGRMSATQARAITVNDALAGTGATLVSLPTHMIQQLGLAKTGTKRVANCTDQVEVSMYDPVRLTIQGRSCTTVCRSR